MRKQQHRAIFELALELGLDIGIVCDVDGLGKESRIPEDVLKEHHPMIQISLPLKFQPQNKIAMDDEVLELNLGFDALYRCRIPWACVKQIAMVPRYVKMKPKAEDVEEPLADTDNVTQLFPRRP